MTDRLKLAASAWFVGWLMAIPSVIAIFLSILVARDAGGAIAFVILPAAAAVALQSVLVKIASKLATPTVYAGPTAVGFVAGIMFSNIATPLLGRSIALLALLTLPAIGAYIGAGMNVVLTPRSVGAGIGMLSLISLVINAVVA